MAEAQEKVPWRKSYFFKPGYVLPCIMEKNNVEKNVKNFEVREDDVFLVTYPKAGTNWTIEIIDAIHNIDNLEVLKTRTLMEKMPMLELGPSIHPELAEDGIVGIPSNIEACINKLPSPRRLPTHLTPELSPAQLFTKKPKTIVVDRNPKDCIVSLLGWHSSTRFLQPVTWDEMFDAYMKGHTEYGDYCDFTIKWAKYKDEPWVLWLRFEDMKKDHKGCCRKIADHLGKTLTDEQLDEVVHITSFEYMKQANATIKGRQMMLRPEGNWQRKGIAGGWRNTFTVAQSEIFNKDYNEKMKGYEYLKYEF